MFNDITLFKSLFRVCFLFVFVWLVWVCGYFLRGGFSTLAKKSVRNILNNKLA